MRKIILSLFAVAVVVRAVVALFQIMYGINNQINLDTFLYGSFDPGFELYHDFYYYYVTQLVDLSKGLLPYRDFGYSYPPFFLYLLYAFFRIGGQSLASVPILLGDAVTAPLVYVIAKRFTRERIALLAGLSYAISPFFLLYEGYLWYSSQPMTFFVLLSLYFLLAKKPIYSAAIFAVAILFKQEIIFLLPIYVAWYVKYHRKDIVKGFATISALIGSVSIPFLILAPRLYISDLSYGLYPAYPTGSEPTNVALGPSTVTSAVANSLTCSTMSGTWRSLVCNIGGFTYTDIKTIPGWSVIFTSGFLNTISFWIAIPMMGLVCYYVYTFRHRFGGSIFLLTSAFALVVFVSIFDVQIHTVYRYYLVPVYALIVASSYNRASLLVSAIVPIASMFLPSGPIQLIPPLGSMIWILTTRFRNEDFANPDLSLSSLQNSA